MLISFIEKKKNTNINISSNENNVDEHLRIKFYIFHIVDDHLKIKLSLSLSLYIYIDYIL